MRKPLAFIYNAVTQALIQILGARTDTIWAPDGLTFTQQQSDGNFVQLQGRSVNPSTSSAKRAKAG
jgi:hypothetical protein